MNKFFKAVADAILLGAILLTIVVLFAAIAQAQTQYVYTVPMLQDTVVVVTNTNVDAAQVAYKFYDSMGIFIEWQSGAMHILPQRTIAKWYCYL